jgi:glyoxylase-like metal-dependent hydrolase (beta-lactamase superfamily II)
MKVRADTRPLTEPLAGGREGATVAVEPLRCGRVSCPPTMFERAEHFATARLLGLGIPRSRWWEVPVPAFLVHHPGAGPFLVDTGLHPSIASSPEENLGAIAARFARPTLEPGGDLPAQLRSRGIEPKGIGLVVMTHLHLDHSSAMSEFAGAAFVVCEQEWTAASTVGRPLTHGYRPSHYDYAFDYRTLSYDSDRISSYASFGRAFDLFGDGSVRLAATPGHSAGHQSVICRLADRDLVIAGDAIYTLGQLDDAPEPPRPFDRHNWRRSRQELRLFRDRYPQAVIVPGHDPGHWATLAKRFE